MENTETHETSSHNIYSQTYWQHQYHEGTIPVYIHTVVILGQIEMTRKWPWHPAAK